MQKIVQSAQKQAVRQLKSCFSSQQACHSFKQSLEETDKEVNEIIQLEKQRQLQGINLIPSENHCSVAVLNALGTHLIGKNGKGYPGQRVFEDSQHLDAIEKLCQKRALETFGLNEEEWGVNVQASSGTHANFAVYGALLQPHDRILGLNLPDGGHLSHGFQTQQKKISMVSQFFESLPYNLHKETHHIDYDDMETKARSYNPKIIIAGTSAYSRLLDYQRFRDVSKDVGAYLLADMSHISGLVASGSVPSPFQYADIVTTTTHKSLRGPRGSMIFYRKGVRSENKKGVKTYYDLEEPINAQVQLRQDGQKVNQTAAIGVALKLAQQPEFKEYQEQVLRNAKAFAEQMTKLGYNLVSKGTDNHLVLVDLRNKKIDGSRAQILLDSIQIFTNKNTVPGDKSALNPGGIRTGTPAMTTRGLLEKDFVEVANFFDRGISMIPQLKKDCGGKKIADFDRFIGNNFKEVPDLVELQKNIVEFTKEFPVPGI